ncbi:two-component regulator propeller domain-containing protein [uncultured Pedobacter sp.]|uniref:hybrid sensor histidine kinase/response regulator transcription factor n=1 Tax=uncultured Pedobacter sp. TaxID=246139 RepID=UPI0025CE9784|nr:two-component regulator propeller domain-containing protein [uncultured Pedobacter sp.]
MPKHLLLLYFLLFVTGRTKADQHNERLFDINDGLSNNSVRCIFQDHYGFMWFGTYDGLNRYDGTVVKVFRNRLKDDYSIPHNYIYCIAEDAENNIWVGTGQGVAIYNALSGKFAPAYYLSKRGDKPYRLTVAVNTIVRDSKGNLFIGTNGAGMFYKGKNDKYPHQICDSNKNQSLSNANIISVAEGDQNHIWIMVNGMGLYHFDAKQKKMVLVNAETKLTNCMLAKENYLWVGTREGLYQFSVIYNNKTPKVSSGKKLANGNIFSLLQNPGYKLWIGTEGRGLSILDLKTLQISQTKLIQHSANNTSGETIPYMYSDKGNRKWISRLNGGVVILDSTKKHFQTFKNNPLIQNSLIHDYVSCLAEKVNGDIWVGTDGGGMSLYSTKANIFTHFRHDPGKQNSLSNNIVTSILTDKKGTTWISTFGGGINRYDEQTQSFKRYHCINDRGPESNYIWLIYQDHQDMIWATAVVDGGIYKLNARSDQFELFDASLSDLNTLKEDSFRQLWAGTSNNLVKIDKQSKKHIYYLVDKPVRSIFEDRNKNLWVGTEGGGLILFDRIKGKIKSQFSDEEGLCNNSVLNILQDDDGYLWLSTYNGLSRFDPVRKTFSNYYSENGLSSNQFSCNAALRLKSGEMAFGSVKGFTLFNPKTFASDKANLPPPYLSSVYVNNRFINATDKLVNQTDQERISELTVPYNDAVLSLTFSSIDFAARGKIKFSYHLEGGNNGWTETTASTPVTFLRLTDGKYILHVKRNNYVGGWGPDYRLLIINVLPPWNRSWLAYLCYALLGSAMIYAYNAYRVRQANLNYEIKTAQTNALKEKELSEKKFAFFTNVSHEFRTPLTLIINPLKDYIQHHPVSGSKGGLDLVYQNAKRLLKLVDQLLLFRKVGGESEDLRISRIPFSEICREVHVGFSGQAALKNLNYDYVCPDAPIELYADREKIQAILYNLISNAIKFTRPYGEIKIQLWETENSVELSIKDNGIGIESHVKDKLFDRFYQVGDDNSASGFGIGLYLVKQFMDQHGALISYESAAGNGTTFFLSFKKGKSHFGNLTVYEDVSPETFQTEDQVKPEPPTLKTDPNLLLSTQDLILIVEDNESIREYIQGIFKKDHLVITASNGKEGLEQAIQHLPDIIITDILMEDGTGLELCSAIKNNSTLGHIPVILLTALSDAENRLKGTQCGADDYITKPFEKELLMARVKALLENRTKLQQYFYNEITLKKQNFKISPEYREFLSKCISIIEQNIGDESFNIKKFSQEIGMSHSGLYRKVKSVSGQSIAGFIRFIRLRKSAELMVESNYTIKEIAWEVGINDIKYFRKQFSALFGMNPSDYIKNYRNTPHK